MRKGKMTAAVVSLAMLYAMGSCGAHAEEQAPKLDVKYARDVMVAWRPPQYPYEARSRHIQGSGMFLLFINPKTGLVTKVRTLHSTGDTRQRGNQRVLVLGLQAECGDHETQSPGHVRDGCQATTGQNASRSSGKTNQITKGATDEYASAKGRASFAIPCGKALSMPPVEGKAFFDIGHAPADHSNRRRDLQGYAAWRFIR